MLNRSGDQAVLAGVAVGRQRFQQRTGLDRQHVGDSFRPQFRQVEEDRLADDAACGFDPSDVAEQLNLNPAAAGLFQLQADRAVIFRLDIGYPTDVKAKFGPLGGGIKIERIVFAG